MSAHNPDNLTPEQVGVADGCPGCETCRTSDPSVTKDATASEWKEGDPMPFYTRRHSDTPRTDAARTLVAENKRGLVFVLAELSALERENAQLLAEVERLERENDKLTTLKESAVSQLDEVINERDAALKESIALSVEVERLKAFINDNPRQ